MLLFGNEFMLSEEGRVTGPRALDPISSSLCDPRLYVSLLCSGMKRQSSSLHTKGDNDSPAG